MCIIRYYWLIALYIFMLLVSNASFQKKNSCVREESSDLPFFLQTQLQKITVEEHIFGEFALSTLTFGLCTSPTDNFPFTYLFSYVPISIRDPLNCSTICTEYDFQRLQRSVKIFNNPGWWISPFLIFIPSIHCISWRKRYGIWTVSIHQFLISR